MKGLKEALAQSKELRHPLHDMLDMINSTPADMIKMKIDQKEDGSKMFQIEIPSRAEQAKQRAMQQALQTGQQPIVTSPGSVDQMMGEPGAQKGSPNVSKMPMGGAGSGAEEKMPAAAAASQKIQIKMAMTPEDEEKLLKVEYPKSFLQSMGLE